MEHIKKSVFMETILRLKGSTWPDIEALGYDKWFFFCKKTGRMWVLPLRNGIAHGRWVVPISGSIPYYEDGNFLGWGDDRGVKEAPEAYGINEHDMRGFEEVIIDDD